MLRSAPAVSFLAVLTLVGIACFEEQLSPRPGEGGSTGALANGGSAANGGATPNGGASSNGGATPNGGASSNGGATSVGGGGMGGSLAMGGMGGALAMGGMGGAGGFGGMLAVGGMGGGTPVTIAPDFAILDVNPNSASYQSAVSPRDYLGKVSAWYFGHST